MRTLIGILLVGNLVAFLWANLYSDSEPVEKISEPDIGNIRLLGETVDSSNVDSQYLKNEEVEPVDDSEEPIAEDVILVTSESQQAFERNKFKSSEVEIETPPAEVAQSSEITASVQLPVSDDGSQDKASIQLPFNDDTSSSKSPLEVIAELPNASLPGDENEVVEENVPSVEPITDIPESIEPTVVVEELVLTNKVDEKLEEEAELDLPPVIDRSESIKSSITPPIQVCANIGPYKKKSDADRMLASLIDEVDTIRVDASSEQSVSGHYVLIPAAKDLATGKATVAALKKAGIKDTWLFRSGKRKYAISLGLFSIKSNAESHAKKLRAKGFNAVIDPKVKSTAVYTVFLKHFDAWPVNEHIFAENLKKYKKNACK